MAQLTGQRGIQALGATSSGPLRQDKTGAAVFSLGRAPLSEPTSLGLLFAASIPPGTGQAPGTAIGTTACMTLGNTAGALVNLVLYQIEVGYISGTLGAGTLGLLAHQATAGVVAPSGGTAITPTNMLLGSAVASVANCRFNNTVPASGILIRSICSLGAALASTALLFTPVVDNINGAIVIAPGQAVSVQGIAASGTSPLIVVSMVWAEESIL